LTSCHFVEAGEFVTADAAEIFSAGDEFVCGTRPSQTPLTP
jgi:hypothetical protein